MKKKELIFKKLGIQAEKMLNTNLGKVGQIEQLEYLLF